MYVWLFGSLMAQLFSKQYRTYDKVDLWTLIISIFAKLMSRTEMNIWYQIYTGLT